MAGITIGSNISALMAQRNLGTASVHLSRSLERLSSGQRINRASDDAAGLAIADSLRVGARLYGTAVRNLNDGLSAANIMSSAVNAQQGILQRLSELAEQSANGVYTQTQRDAMNNEYQTLVEEFARTAETATFNGISLLTAGRGASPSQLTLQAGINGEQTSQLEIAGVNTAKFSGVVGAAGDYNNDGDVNGDDQVPLDMTGDFPSFDAIQAAAAGALFRMKVKDSAGAEKQVYLAPMLTGISPGEASFWAFERTSDGRFRKIIETYEVLNSPSLSLNLSFLSGSTATLNLDLSGVEFREINGDELTAIANWELDDPEGIPLRHPGPGIYSAKSCLETTGVETVGTARDALNAISNRQRELSLIQGQIGSMQSRLSIAVNLATTSRENLQAAESRIRDVDVAAEAASLTSAQILQQAATSVLAQANQAPALALQLLRA